MKSVRNHRLLFTSIFAMLGALGGAALAWWQQAFSLDPSYRLLAVGLAAGALLPIGLSLFNGFLKESLYQTMPMIWAFIFHLLFDAAWVFALAIGTLWAGGYFKQFWDIGAFLAETRTLVAAGAVMLCLFLHHYWGLFRLILGPGRLGAHLSGRYRYPRISKRFVLAIELQEQAEAGLDRDSPRWYGFLNDFLQLVERQAVAHRAEIHELSTRGILLTWPETQGDANNDAIHLVHEVRTLLSRQETWYHVVYHKLPQFRAALEFGAVIRSELGWRRRTLVCHGKAVHGAQRLLLAAAQLRADFCVSQEAMDRLILPAGSRINRSASLAQPDHRGEGTHFYVLEQIARS